MSAKEILVIADQIIQKLEQNNVSKLPPKDVVDYIEVYRNILLIISRNKTSIDSDIERGIRFHKTVLEDLLQDSILKTSGLMQSRRAKYAKITSTVARVVGESLNIIDGILLRSKKTIL